MCAFPLLQNCVKCLDVLFDTNMNEEYPKNNHFVFHVFTAICSSSIFYVQIIVQFKINKHKIWKQRSCVEALCCDLYLCFYQLQ